MAPVTHYTQRLLLKVRSEGLGHGRVHVAGDGTLLGLDVELVSQTAAV